VTAMLHERLAGGRLDERAARGGVAAHRVDVLVYALVLPQPLALARVARQRLGLLFDLIPDVNDRRRLRRLAERADAFERVAVVQMRNATGGQSVADRHARRV